MNAENNFYHVLLKNVMPLKANSLHLKRFFIIIAFRMLLTTWPKELMNIKKITSRRCWNLLGNNFNTLSGIFVYEKHVPFEF